MLESRSEENRVDELAEEFARRWRNREEPSVEEYALRYPQWAEQIRAVLPAVALMEQLKPCCEEVKPAVPSEPADRLPERIGAYRIVREIGRGGMGVVYEADQETLGRRVAIKVLPAHVLVNDRVRARFHRESQAAARLHHTNIVPVFDVGEHEGLCFYVMQLIAGCGLDDAISEAAAQGKGPCRPTERAPASTTAPSSASSPPDEEGVRPARPGRGLLTPLAPRDLGRTAARIGVQVAEALAHAHSQGILHRDIKPSNLLVDDRGTVWVTDFGVAKLVEEANLTHSGDLVGTLKYMPPERFSGHSDARGDVYSLGMTLYELLTLQPAFPDTTPHHLIHLITQGAPTPPRRLNADIPVDLETIVLKAMARDPAHRYQTAADLADDLRRFLDDCPILARRITLAERAWRWCRRSPALALASAASFLLMVAITAVSLVAGRQTAAANQEMQMALAAEKTEREHAEKTATLALEALNRIYDHFAPTRLVVTPQPASAEGIELPPQPALPPEAVPVLEDLLRTYGQIARLGGEFPGLHAQAAEANYRIGDIAQRLGRFEEAATAYRTAIDLYTPLLDRSAEASVRIKLARACNELGRALRSLQKPEEERRMHERAIQVLTEAPPNQARLPECRYELARSYCIGPPDMFLSPSFGPGHAPPPEGPGHCPPGPPPPLPPGKGHPAQQAAALLEQLVEEHPKVPEYRHLLACCYRDMRPPRLDTKSPAKNSNSSRAVELLRQLVADFPRVPDYCFDLCEALGHSGPPAPPGKAALEQKTIEQLEEAIRLSAKLVVHYPNVPEYSAAHARYHDKLGMTLRRLGRLEEAEQHHRKAVSLQVRLVKQYPEVIAYRCWLSLMERSLGRALSARGELKEARGLIEGAIERVEKLSKKDPRLGGLYPFLEMAWQDLAVVLDRSGEPRLAAAALVRAEAYGKIRGHGFRPPPREKGLR